MSIFTVKNLSFSFGKKHILSDINIGDVQKGEIIGVIGPNGVGKSTLFKCMSRFLKTPSSSVFLHDKDICTIKESSLAQQVCYIPQNVYSTAHLTVFEVVLLARKFAAKKTTTDEDINIVSNVIETIDIPDLANSYISTLSGGELQLTALAQAIVRQPQVLILDEPTSALDIHHQFEMLNIINNLVKTFGIVCFMSQHDINLVSRYADRIALIHDTSIQVDIPKNVLTSENIEKVYKVEANVSHNDDGTITVTVLRSINKDLDTNIDAIKSLFTQTVHA